MRRRAIAITCLLAFSSLSTTVFALSRGEQAPEIGLRDRDGHDITVAGARGRVLVVAFWGSWCAPCEQELRVLDRLYGQLGADALTIVGVSEDGSDSNVESFLRRIPVSFPVVRDGDHAVARRYSLGAMATFIFDRGGALRHVHEGFRQTDAPVIEAELRALLADR